MPPVAVHLSFAVLGILLIARRFERRQDRRAVAWGFVLGAVLVDADLIVAGIVSLFGGSADSGELVHRTLTHSVTWVAGFAIAGFLLVRADRRFAGVTCAAIAFSTAVFHIFPDIFYLVPVKMFFPFSLAGVQYGPFYIERFSDVQKNVITGLDFLSESFAWLLLWWLAREYGLGTRFTRLLPYFALANVLLYGAELFFVAPNVPYDSGGAWQNFLYWSYTPGQLNLVVSTLLAPILGRHVWMAFGEAPRPRWVRAEAPREAGERRAPGPARD